jgi:hypothetical protein
MTASRQHRVRGEPCPSHTVSAVQSPAMSTTSLWEGAREDETSAAVARRCPKMASEEAVDDSADDAWTPGGRAALSTTPLCRRADLASALRRGAQRRTAGMYRTHGRDPASPARQGCRAFRGEAGLSPLCPDRASGESGRYIFRGRYREEGTALSINAWIPLQKP